MKKNRVGLLAGAVLVLVTVVAAAIHLTGRISPAEGALYIEKDGRSTELAISDMALEPVRGTVVNGKGRPAALTAGAFRSLPFWSRWRCRQTAR